MDYKSNKKEYLKIRKTLRNNLTPAEATIWKYIKNKRICNAQWRRQFSIGKYILDFYCPAAKLAIELDGNGHYKIEGDRYDYERENFISRKGIKIIRYENCEVWNSLELIIERIEKETAQRLNSTKNSPSWIRGSARKGEGVRKTKTTVPLRQEGRGAKRRREFEKTLKTQSPPA